MRPSWSGRNDRTGPTARSMVDPAHTLAAARDSNRKAVSLRTPTPRHSRYGSEAVADGQLRRQGRDRNTSRRGRSAGQGPLDDRIEFFNDRKTPSFGTAFLADAYPPVENRHAYFRRPSSFCSFEGRSWVVGLSGFAGSCLIGFFASSGMFDSVSCGWTIFAAWVGRPGAGSAPARTRA